MDLKKYKMIFSDTFFECESEYRYSDISSSGSDSQKTVLDKLDEALKEYCISVESEKNETKCLLNHQFDDDSNENIFKIVSEKEKKRMNPLYVSRLSDDILDYYYDFSEDKKTLPRKIITKVKDLVFNAKNIKDYLKK